MKEFFFFILGMNFTLFVLYIINRPIRKELIKFLEYLEGGTSNET